MSFPDVAILLGYFPLILLISWIFSSLRYGEEVALKYFMPGITLKLLGGIAFCLIYKFYYGGGDTFGYYKDSVVLTETLWSDPAIGWEILNSTSSSFNVKFAAITDEMSFARGKSTFWVIKVATIFNFFSFNNFFGTALLFSSFAFLGMWSLFRVFVKLFPNAEVEAALSCFWVPSVVFWGSGIMKDSLVIGALGLAIYGFYNLLILRKNHLSSLFLLWLGCFVILKIKFYVLLALLPMFTIWLLTHYHRYVKDVRLKFASWILGLAFGVLFFYFYLPTLKIMLSSAAEDLLFTAAGFYNWHTYLGDEGLTGGGSLYSLGEMTYTPLGILKKVPAAINVTLFRPYLTEVSSPIVLITAFESLSYLLLTLWVVLRRGFFRVIKKFWQNPAVLAFLVFVLLFAFIVGFTSFNFGALVRYKIPCLPFLTFILLLLMTNKMTDVQYENNSVI